MKKQTMIVLSATLIMILVSAGIFAAQSVTLPNEKTNNNYYKEKIIKNNIDKTCPFIKYDGKCYSNKEFTVKEGDIFYTDDKIIYVESVWGSICVEENGEIMCTNTVPMVKLFISNKCNEKYPVACIASVQEVDLLIGETLKLDGKKEFEIRLEETNGATKEATFSIAHVTYKSEAGGSMDGNGSPYQNITIYSEEKNPSTIETESDSGKIETTETKRDLDKIKIKTNSEYVKNIDSKINMKEENLMKKFIDEFKKIFLRKV